MGKIQRISESEKQIMNIIWAAESAITTSEIMKCLSEEKAWKQSTVITFLSRLVEKGIVRAKRIGKANHYEPCITEQEYLNFETKQFIKDVYNGSTIGLITALYDNNDLTKEDIESLLKRLKE